MKLTLKLFLVVCLFSSISLAEEGDMGSGGKTCTQGQPTCRPPQPPPPPDADRVTTETDSILTIIQNYLTSIFE